MRYRVDNYLPKAFEAITHVKIGNKTFVDNNVIPREYKGYISSLGANIIQAGIQAALTFYEADESGSKSDRRLVNAAIKYIINTAEDAAEDAAEQEYSDYKLTELLKGLSIDELQRKAEDILDAATALKLALRTYKMK